MKFSIELKENQTVLIVEHNQLTDQISGEIHSGSPSGSFDKYVAEAIEELWHELMDTATTLQYDEAHTHSIRHRKEIMESKFCGCFFCMEMFDPAEIEIWTDYNENDSEGQTAMCPYCFTDSVIGDKSGFPVINSFLEGMCLQWFGETVVEIYRERTKIMYGAQRD